MFVEDRCVETGDADARLADAILATTAVVADIPSVVQNWTCPTQRSVNERWSGERKLLCTKYEEEGDR
jgi:hypothetical protein